MTNLTKVFFMVSIFACSPLLSQEVLAKTIYIVTNNLDLPPLSKSQVKMIYRGKSTRLSGEKISLLDLPSDSNVRKQFYSTLLRKNTTQMYTQWASLAFSGKVAVPTELNVSSKEALIDWVSNTPNGVAYFDFDQIPPSLNILYKLEVNDEN